MGMTDSIVLFPEGGTTNPSLAKLYSLMSVADSLSLQMLQKNEILRVGPKTAYLKMVQSVLQERASRSIPLLRLGHSLVRAKDVVDQSLKYA